MQRARVWMRYLKSLGEVAEGVPTAKAIYKIAKEKEIYLPIAAEVYAMIEEGKRSFGKCKRSAGLK